MGYNLPLLKMLPYVFYWSTGFLFCVFIWSIVSKGRIIYKGT